MIKVTTYNCNFSNSYLVENQNQGFIVDPSYPLEEIKSDKTCKIVGVFLTHGHYDHFCFLESFLNKGITFYMHKKALEKINDDSLSYAQAFGSKTNYNLKNENIVFLNDGDDVEIIGKHVKIIHTPGHTSCCVCLLIDDLLFSGDTLFKKTVGRTDLITGNILELKNSLKKIMNLKINYHIYPGHDDDTYLDDEKKNNRFMR